MDKKPGIFSARWAGSKGDFNKAIKRVYKGLDKKDKNWRAKKIKARFVCALSICYLDKIIGSVIGKIEGSISNKIRGKNGFGYDPIFEIDGSTLAELSFEEKTDISHRKIAAKKMRDLLTDTFTE